MASSMAAPNFESNGFLELASSNFPDKIVKSEDNRKKFSYIHRGLRNQGNLKHGSKRNELNAASKVENLTPKVRYDEFIEPSHVKISALLYEITKRTNQLAQPRVRITDSKPLERHLTVSQIPKASSRVIELARPRTIYQQPPKQVRYVAPGALTAVATQRIIELSKPKKKRRLKVSKRRKSTYASYNSRAASKLQKGKSRTQTRHVKRRTDQEQDSFVERKNDQKLKRRRILKMKDRSLRSTNSNRTIIMVDLNLKNTSKMKSKKAGKVR